MGSPGSHILKRHSVLYCTSAQSLVHPKLGPWLGHHDQLQRATLNTSANAPAAYHCSLICLKKQPGIQTTAWLHGGYAVFLQRMIYRPWERTAATSQREWGPCVSQQAQLFCYWFCLLKQCAENKWMSVMDGIPMTLTLTHWWQWVPQQEHGCCDTKNTAQEVSGKHGKELKVSTWPQKFLRSKSNWASIHTWQIVISGVPTL